MTSQASRKTKGNYGRASGAGFEGLLVAGRK